MPALTERRKADRAKMAEKLATIALEYGATVEIEREGENSICPRRIQVSIVAARGLACGFDFDGESCQPDIYVNGWHMGLNTDACLSDRFPGSVNNSHFRKSTTVRHGFDDLCDHVRQVLEMANAGTCFDAERESRHVAKNGTWQESAARFEQWRQELQANKAATSSAV